MRRFDQNSSDVNLIKEIVEMIIYVVAVCLVAWLIITFVGQRTVVNGDSMKNTLHDQESLWVSKLSYHLHDPERFDIVIFPYEEDQQDVYFVKRIIGLPGETVRIDEDGNIYINGKILDEDYGLETIDTRHLGDAYEEIKIGENEYFVMGDNRNNSMDSRYIGNISRDELIGKAVFRMWPLSKLGKVE